MSQQLDDVEAALDAVAVSEDLQEIDLQEMDISEQGQIQEQVEHRRNELKGHQIRIQQLRKADDTLAKIITSYDEMAEVRHQLPELEKQISDLERREQEDLPLLEKRVNELGELTRSFGTLQRLSNDLLSAVDAIKDLEQEQKQHNEVLNDLKSVEQEVAHSRSRLQEAQQALQDIEERRRSGRPQLEARLQRMKTLSERLLVLRQVEDRYVHRMAGIELAEENAARLAKIQNDLQNTEQSLTLIEADATQLQSQADTVEKHWHQISLRHQLEEWCRVKGLSQNLNDAEQKVRLAHQQQEKLMMALNTARSTAFKFLGIGIISVLAFLVCIILAFLLHTSASLTIVLVFVAIVGVACAACRLLQYRKARAEKTIADQKVQNAINQFSLFFGARD